MRRAATTADWSEVRALRHEALHARGDIAAGGDGEFGDIFDHAFNSQTFVLWSGAKAIGTTRTSASSAHRRWPLPVDEPFGAEIAALGAEATLVEASLTVADPSSAMDWKNVLFHLFKAHMLECAQEGADWLLIAVRESQIGFYRRMFNMEILSGGERYGGFTTPRVLMGLEYHAQAQLLAKRIPLIAVSAEDEREFAQTGAIAFRKPRRGAGGEPRAPASR